MESPVSDGTIEENFEEALGSVSMISEAAEVTETTTDDFDEFADVAKYGIVDVVGDDTYGRKVIVVSACRLPSNKVLDHNRFLRYLIVLTRPFSLASSVYTVNFMFIKFFRYLMYTLDQFVEEDYSVVYFHNGLNSQNKPPFRWLLQAYRAFDRKYKKNLKALYLVHPTNFIRVVWQLFKPFIR